MSSQIVEVRIAPFGGPFGGRDGHGEYFTHRTDFWLDRIPARPVIKHHGLTENKPQIVGRETAIWNDATGIWATIELNDNNLWEAAQAGHLKASTGAIAHLVRTQQNGEILAWPIAEISLIDDRTAAVANPYAVAIPQIKSTYEAAGLTYPPLEEPMPETDTITQAINEAVANAIQAALPREAPSPTGLIRTPATIKQRGEPDPNASDFPISAAIAAMHRGQFKTIEIPIPDLCGPAAIKTLAERTDAAGGFLVAIEHSQTLIEMLWAAMILPQLGVTTWPMASDQLTVNTLVSGPTAYWVDENAPIGASDLAFGQCQMFAKKVAALTKISSELVRDSSPAAEQIVRRQLSNALAREIDTQAIQGTGASGQPLGLQKHPITRTDAGGAPTFADLDGMAQRLALDNIPEPWTYLMHHRTRNTLMSIMYSDGAGATSEYMWEKLVTGGVYRDYGKIVYSNALAITQGAGAETSIYVGHWPHFMLGMRQTIELKASDEAGDAFEYDQLWVRAIARVDVNIEHPESFEELHGVTT